MQVVLGDGSGTSMQSQSYIKIHLKLLNDSTQMSLLLSSHLVLNGGQLTVLNAGHQIYGFGSEL